MVFVENMLFSSIPVSSGVVQGSVLGPLIFILFIDDIVDCLDSNEICPTSCSIFADDLKLYCAYDSINDVCSLSNTIRNIELWSAKWQLRINPDKSSLIQVGNVYCQRFQYTICDTTVNPSLCVRDLGITYDSKLCFYNYIDDIVKRAFQRVNLLFRSFVSGNVTILTKAYITYVRPLLEYCTFIWSPFQIYLIEKIERVQRYFSRRVLFRTRLSYTERLRILHLDTLEARRIKFDLKLCFKIINNLCGLDPANFFIFAPSTLTRGHEFKLIKPICRNNWLLNFYSNRVVNFWNSLPPDVVNARTYNIFVNKLNCIDVSIFCHIGRA